MAALAGPVTASAASTTAAPVMALRPETREGSESKEGLLVDGGWGTSRSSHAGERRASGATPIPAQLLPGSRKEPDGHPTRLCGQPRRSAPAHRRSPTAMKKLEQHLSEPVIGSCLVTPNGAAAGAFAADAAPRGRARVGQADRAAAPHVGRRFALGSSTCRARKAARRARSSTGSRPPSDHATRPPTSHPSPTGARRPRRDRGRGARRRQRPRARMTVRRCARRPAS